MLLSPDRSSYCFISAGRFEMWGMCKACRGISEHAGRLWQTLKIPRQPTNIPEVHNFKDDCRSDTLESVRSSQFMKRSGDNLVAKTCRLFVFIVLIFDAHDEIYVFDYFKILIVTSLLRWECVWWVPVWQFQGRVIKPRRCKFLFMSLMSP